MKKRFFMIATVVFALTAAVLLMVKIITQHQTEQAFTGNNKQYDRVQIEITQRGKNYSPMLMDDLKYYNDEISFEESTEQTAEYDVEKTVCIVKAEDVYMEESQGEKTYFYLDGDREYILSYIPLVPEMNGQGVWEAVPAEEVQLVKSFDFAVLDRLDRNKMDQKGSRFTVQGGYLNEALFLLLNVSDSLQKDYRCDRLEFVLKGSRLAGISVEFAYMGDLYMEYNYSFSYENTEIILPQPDSTNQ